MWASLSSWKLKRLRKEEGDLIPTLTFLTSLCFPMQVTRLYTAESGSHDPPWPIHNAYPIIPVGLIKP